MYEIAVYKAFILVTTLHVSVQPVFLRLINLSVKDLLHKKVILTPHDTATDA
jgi:hypothetical protein